MRLLAHPFRLAANGSAATVEADTDEAIAQGIAILCLTGKGERDLVPDYGITDPVGQGIDLAEVNVGLADFGPPVTVTALNVTHPDDRTERVELVYDSQE